MKSVRFFTLTAMFHMCIISYSSSSYNHDRHLFHADYIPESNYKQSSLDEAKDIYNRKNCGKSLKHLGGLLLDKSDKESKLIVEGSVVSNKLILKIGNIKEKEIPVNNIILPVETLSKKCIHIRHTKPEESAVLCLSTTVMRNFWINSITDAVLCNQTKINGKLPEFNYLTEEEKIEEEQQEEKEAEQEKETETEKETDKEKIEDTQAPAPAPTPTPTKKEDANFVNKEKKIDTTTETQLEEQKEKVKKDEIIEKEKLRKQLVREEFDDDIEHGTEERGLKLRIAKSKYGYAKVKIDGKGIDEIKKDEELIKILKNEEKEMAQRSSQDIDELDEVDIMDDF